MVSCWVYSLALETAGTHKDHEPFLTGLPGVMGSLWGNENLILQQSYVVTVQGKQRKYC